MTPRTARAWASWALLALVCGLPLALAALAARRELAPDGIGIDDAYIFLRYGRNLAQGLGWVWNPGGIAVEGFSSLLWTVVTAGAFRFTPAPESLLFACSLALVGGALVAWLATPRLPAHRDRLALGLAVAVYLAAEPSFAVWTGAALMDGALWCAVLLFLATSHALWARVESGAGPVAAAAVAQLLLAVTRPEALLVGPLAIAAVAIASRRPWRRLRPPAIAAVGAQLALLVWRLTTFGWPLPNTYYAKVDESFGARLAGGSRYLLAAVRDEPWRAAVWALALVVVVGALRARFRPADAESPDPAVVVAAFLVLAAPGIVLAEGGDFFPGQRTLAPFRPLEATVLMLIVRQVLVRRGWRRASLLASIGLVLCALSGYGLGAARWGALEETTLHGKDYLAARQGIDRASRLERLFGERPRRPTVAAIAAGTQAYGYRGPSRDLLALNDPAMAHASRRRQGAHGHSAFHADAFFADPPDLLQIGPQLCAGLPAERTARQRILRTVLRRLGDDPRFATTYRLVQLLDPLTGEPVLCTYARRAWLEREAERITLAEVDDRTAAERQSGVPPPTP